MAINNTIGIEVKKRLQDISDIKQESDESVKRSLEAKENADEAKHRSDITKKQLDEAIKNGDQVVEVQTLRVDPITGKVHGTAAERFEENQKEINEEIGIKTGLPEWLQEDLRKVSKMHDDYLRQISINVRTPPYNAKANANYFNPSDRNWYQNRYKDQEGNYIYSDLADDDSDAVQAAIDALPNSGGKLYFPSGKYLISKPLNNYKNTVFDAEGNETEGESGALHGNRIEHIIFEGESMDSTTLITSHPDGFTRPYADVPKAYYRLTFNNLRFQGVDKIGRSMTIRSDEAFPLYLKFNKCMLTGYEYGFIYDFFEGGSHRNGFTSFEQCLIMGNEVGVYTTSDSNSFYHTDIWSNSRIGLFVKYGYSTSVHGGKIQANAKDKGENYGQIVIGGGVGSINFTGVYIEGRYTTDEQTRGDIIVRIAAEKDNTVTRSIKFSDCYINGLGSMYFLSTKNTSGLTTHIRGLTLDNCYLRRFVLNSDHELFETDKGDSIQDLEHTGGYITDLSDKNGKNISHLDWIFSKNRNIKYINSDYQRAIIYSSPDQSYSKRQTLVSGVVRGDGEILYGSGFSVIRESGGVYLITFDHGSINTNTIEETRQQYFPIVVTTHLSAHKEETFATVEHINNKSVRVIINKAEDVTYSTESFNFFAMINSNY